MTNKEELKYCVQGCRELAAWIEKDRELPVRKIQKNMAGDHSDKYYFVHEIQDNMLAWDYAQHKPLGLVLLTWSEFESKVLSSVQEVINNYEIY